MKYTVYVLRSIRDGKRYVGFTNNLNRRIQEHNKGKVASTRKRVPLKLVRKEYFKTKQEAQVREMFLKTGKGRKWLNDNGIK